jgi:G3E family GTPase
MASLLTRLKRINPDAPIMPASRFDAGIFLRQGTEVHAHSSFGHARDAPPEHGHGERIRSFVVTVDEPIDWTAFGVWLTMLLNRHGDKVLRVKGILNLAGEPSPVAIHGVGRLVHNPSHMAAWPDLDRRSRIVFIVDDLDPALIQRSLAAFRGIARGGTV